MLSLQILKTRIVGDAHCALTESVVYVRVTPYQSM